SGLERVASPYSIEGFHLQSSTDLARRTGCPLVVPPSEETPWHHWRILRELTNQGHHGLDVIDGIY
ncbi:MAG: hypothetical protein KUG78_21505, partial [Kangiellaceae bacterium]|nr:hypothetical protein [Kangiellaceae bacterium]